MADGTDVGEVAARPRKPWTRRPQAPLASLAPGTLLTSRQAREYLGIPGDAFRARVRRGSPFAPRARVDERGRRAFLVSDVLAFIERVPRAREYRPNLVSNANAEMVPDIPLQALPAGRLLGMKAAGRYMNLTSGGVWRRLKKGTYPVLPWRMIAGVWRIRVDELQLSLVLMRSPSEQGKVNAASRKLKAVARRAGEAARP